jgi:hypothetical protein
MEAGGRLCMGVGRVTEGSVVIENVRGLTVAFVTEEDVLDGKWNSYCGSVDVVRVVDPRISLWSALAGAGFSPKPAYVNWKAPACASEGEFLKSMSRRNRESIATSRKRASEFGLQLEVQGIEEQNFDEFLILYEDNIGAMRHGWLVASENREKLLNARDRHFLVRATIEGDFVGACVCEMSSADSLVRLKYSATAEDGKALGLVRLMYLEMFAEARRRKFEKVGLGIDPNLFGHIVKPGLFGFKARFGFTPDPDCAPGGRKGATHADRILRFTELTDPSLSVCYVADALSGGAVDSGSMLRLETYSTQADVDASQYISKLAMDSRHKVVAF